MIHEYEQRDGLSCVTERPEDTLVNVLFVHGLGGGAFSTWNSGNSTELGFWPKSVAIEHPQCCVWTLHYTARILEWNPFARSSTIDLLDRAAWLAELLVLKCIPTKPIVFVAHSLGGILVKQALQFAQSLGPPQWRTVWEQTQAVLFLATPHVGSELANVSITLANAVRTANPLTSLFFRPSPALRNLKKDNPILRYLGDWYRDQVQVQGMETIAFAEGRPYFGTMIVSESSANPQIANVRAMPLPSDDHISIAKPADRTHPVHLSLGKCLREVEKRARSGGNQLFSAQAPLDQATIARMAEIRRLIARISGAWWEYIEREGVNKISFFRILPDMLFNSVLLDGNSYDGDGSRVAKWDSVIARVEKERNKIVISYLWKGLHTDPRIANLQFHGFGIFEFDEPGAGEMVSRGGGRFWDVDEAHPEKTILKPMKLRRVLNNDDIRKMTSGSDSEIQKLVKTTISEWRVS